MEPDDAMTMSEQDGTPVDGSGQAGDRPWRSLSAMSFKMPRYITDSAWIEHGPFAMWLVGAARPKVVVELGVYSGFSYMALCQAVQDANLSTSCYGVDTWAGDEHGGFYPESVYEQLKTYNSQHYSSFSSLIRLPFKDAVNYFPDGSIDLLHIDGRHLLEDVTGDFETWRPKLSPSAIVLFHDTNVRNNNFGVWSAWHEYCELYPSFAFVHGNGLGVMALDGRAAPKAVMPLLSCSPEEARMVRAAYSRLGASLSDRLRAQNFEARDGALAERARADAARIEDLEGALAEVNTTPDELRSLREQSLALSDLSLRARDTDALLLSSRQAHAELQAEHDRVLGQMYHLHKSQADLETIEALVPHLKAELELKNAALAEAGDVGARERDLEAARKRIADLQQSQAEFESLKAQAAGLKRQADEAAGWLDDLRESRREVREMYSRLAASEAQAAAMEAERASLTGEADRLRREVAAISAELGELKTLSNDINNQLVDSLRWSDDQSRVIRALRQRQSEASRPRAQLLSRTTRGVKSMLRLRLVDDVRRNRRIRERCELLRASGLFDPDWYIRRYSDIIGPGVDPLIHFVLHGSAEGRDPGPAFSSARYLSTYPDVASRGDEPVFHFIRHGRAEGRVGAPVDA